jgi:hypothetical protein
MRNIKQPRIIRRLSEIRALSRLIREHNKAAAVGAGESITYTEITTLMTEVKRIQRAATTGRQIDAQAWDRCVEQLLGPRHIGDDPEARNSAAISLAIAALNTAGEHDIALALSEQL